MKVICDAMGRVSFFIATLSLCLLPWADPSVITKDCTFSSASKVAVSSDLGTNVCIKRADTDSSSSNGGHFIICSGASTFRSSGDIGNADLCRNYNQKPGIGIDFPGEATVDMLGLVCENSSGTKMEVNEISVYIRPDKSIEFRSQSEDGTVDAILDETTVVAKFVGRGDDLMMIVVPEGVTCNIMTDDNNCRFASNSFESELTATCTVTPVSLVDSGEKTFTRNSTNEILATVILNVIPNNTETTPMDPPPTTLDAGEISGIAIGTIGLVCLIVIVAVLFVLFFVIVRCVGPGPESQQYHMERGETPARRYDYVSFGQGIPETVKRGILTQFNAEEYKLNGRSVEERFGGSNDKVLCVTTSREYSELAADSNPSLTAQMRHLADTDQSGRVHVVRMSDETLQEVEGGQDTDGVSPAVAYVKEDLRQQLADQRPPFLSQSSTDSRVVTYLQSIHRMVFQARVDAANATNRVTRPVSPATSVDGQAPASQNGQVMRQDQGHGEDSDSEI